MTKKLTKKILAATVAICLGFIGCKKNESGQSLSPVSEWKISKDNKKEKPLSSIVDSGSSASSKSFKIESIGCGSNPSGTYYGSGYYSYPPYTIDLSSTPQGSVITINLYSYDVPNRFTVKDSTGTIVASTSWMGYVTYSGPWGMSLNSPQSKTLQFTKDLISTYTLVVETSTQSYSDAWDANIGCASPNATWINTKNIGTFHNNAMTSMDGSFTSSPTTVQAADVLCQGYEYTYTTNAHVNLSKTITDSSYGFRNQIFGINYMANFFPLNTDFKHIADSMMSLDVNSICLNVNEKDLVDSLLIYYIQYGSGSIGYTGMKARISGLKTKWNQWGFNSSLHQGDVSRYTLEVADSSITYWQRYNGGITRQGTTINEKMMVVPPWVAADAVGALAGAIGAGLDSYSNTGHVNWNSVGAWALAGAIGASIPSTRWFTKLFR